MPQSWQESEGHWQDCHWWRDLKQRSIPAMTNLLLLLIVLSAFAGLLGLLVREVLLDGYGRRPGPRSHVTG